MLVSELIAKLQTAQAAVGDVKVTITDGYEAIGYDGNFAVERFYDFQNNEMTIDIGIGGTRLD